MENKFRKLCIRESVLSAKSLRRNSGRPLSKNSGKITQKYSKRKIRMNFLNNFPGKSEKGPEGIPEVIF